VSYVSSGLALPVNFLDHEQRLFIAVLRNCQFCQLKNPPADDDETFPHLFFSCSVTNKWHDLFLSKFFPEINFGNREDKMQFLFLGIPPGTDCSDKLLCLIVQCWLFCIWEEKLRRRAPSFHTLSTLFLEQLRPIINSSEKLFIKCFKSEFSLCRIFAPRPAMNIRNNGPGGPV